MCCFEDGSRDFRRAHHLAMRGRDRPALSRVAANIEREATRHDLPRLGEEFCFRFFYGDYNGCLVVLSDLEWATSLEARQAEAAYNQRLTAAAAQSGFGLTPSQLALL